MLRKILILCFVSTLALAQPDPRLAEIAKKFPDAKPEDIRPSPLPGLYELRRGGDVAYVTPDGRYALMGDLYDLKSNANLTDARRRELRIALLAQIPDNQAVIFSPKDPKYTITVFTDVDCGYCRKLHSQIAEYNKLGIRVKYLFFPRSGPDTAAWFEAESVWCSPNRNDALTRAKKGEKLPPAKCGATPVKRHFELGEEIGVQGTPSIFLSSGEMLPGYVPPDVLADHLRTTKG